MEMPPTQVTNFTPTSAANFRLLIAPSSSGLCMLQKECEESSKTSDYYHCKIRMPIKNIRLLLHFSFIRILPQTVRELFIHPQRTHPIIIHFKNKKIVVVSAFFFCGLLPPQSMFFATVNHPKNITEQVLKFT